MCSHICFLTQKFKCSLESLPRNIIGLEVNELLACKQDVRLHFHILFPKKVVDILVSWKDGIHEVCFTQNEFLVHGDSLSSRFWTHIRYFSATWCWCSILHWKKTNPVVQSTKRPLGLKCVSFGSSHPFLINEPDLYLLNRKLFSRAADVVELHVKRYQWNEIGMSTFPPPLGSVCMISILILEKKKDAQCIWMGWGGREGSHHSFHIWKDEYIYLNICISPFPSKKKQSRWCDSTQNILVLSGW